MHIWEDNIKMDLTEVVCIAVVVIVVIIIINIISMLMYNI
jgi:preprotein translocase subunit Sec61beta